MASKSTKVLQNVPLSKRRCGFTHVAMICDDTSLQPRLPQILIGNEAIFPVAKLESVRPSLPPNIRLWRRKTGWVTAEVMRDIVRELSAALGELKATRTVVLLLDTAPVHLCERFINMAARHKIAVQIIPAKMTWLLQPLDTHAFARFKMHLMHQYRAQLLRSARGECELTAVLESVILAIRHVLQGVAWAYAFDGNGFGTNGQAHLRTRILKEMEWERLPELPARLPEYADLTSVFSKAEENPTRGHAQALQGAGSRASSRGSRGRASSRRCGSQPTAPSLVWSAAQLQPLGGATSSREASSAAPTCRGSTSQGATATNSGCTAASAWPQPSTTFQISCRKAAASPTTT